MLKKSLIWVQGIVYSKKSPTFAPAFLEKESTLK